MTDFNMVPDDEDVELLVDKDDSPVENTILDSLKNELKRYLRKEDFQSAEATRARIAELTTELKTCRRDIVLCSDIADRSEQVRKNLEQIEQQKIERKERTENELLVRRSSRAGREDDTQRR